LFSGQLSGSSVCLCSLSLWLPGFEVMALSSVMPIEVELDPIPTDLLGDNIARGLLDLMEKGELCDVEFVIGDESFLAHRCVLASASTCFRESLQLPATSDTALGQRWKLPLDADLRPAAVRLMLDCIYGAFIGPGASDGISAKQFDAATDAVNRDVLRLAQRFQLPRLEGHAACWLARNLTTANVVQRLTMCEEFRLSAVRAQILAHLMASPAALLQVAKSPEVAGTPLVLQDLLVQVLTVLEYDTASEESAKPPSQKKARKAGA